MNAQGEETSTLSLKMYLPNPSICFTNQWNVLEGGNLVSDLIVCHLCLQQETVSKSLMTIQISLVMFSTCARV